MLNTYPRAQSREYVRRRSPKYAGLGTLASAAGQLSPLAQGRGTAAVATTPEWQFVERITLGSAQTTQDFATVLNGNVDLGYKIVMSVIAGSVTTPALAVRVNGATFAANRRFVYAASTTVSTGATGSSAFFGQMQGTGGTAKQLTGSLELRYARTGYERIWRMFASKVENTTDWQSLFVGTFRMTTPNTATNITSLGIHCDQASGLGVGSIFTLYKKGG